MVKEGLLSGGAAGWSFAERGSADADVGYQASFAFGYEREAREGNFGDGLGVASSDLADVGAVDGEAAFEMDAEEEFIGREDGFLVAEVEVAVGKGAGAAGGDEGNAGVVDEQRGGRVGGRTRIHDISAYRPAVLVGDGAGPACGLGEEGEVGCDHRVLANVGEGGAGS